MASDLDFNTGSLPQCKSEYFSCFKDCCIRGEQFCSTTAQRCIFCSMHIARCNDTSLPRDCDLYCFKQTLTISSGTNECGHPIYFYATWILVAVVALLLFGILCYLKLNSSRKRTGGQGSGPRTSEDSNSSLQSDPEDPETKEQLKESETARLILTDFKDQSSNEAIRDTHSPHREQRMQPLPQQLPLTVQPPQEEQLRTPFPMPQSPAPSGDPPTGVQTENMRCRDPRLDNVRPSSTSRDECKLVIHTGLAPYRAPNNWS